METKMTGAEGLLSGVYLFSLLIFLFFFFFFTHFPLPTSPSSQLIHPTPQPHLIEDCLRVVALPSPAHIMRKKVGKKSPDVMKAASVSLHFHFHSTVRTPAYLNGNE